MGFSRQEYWSGVPFLSPIMEKIEGKRRKKRQRMRWLGGITVAMNINLGKLWEMVRDREA